MSENEVGRQPLQIVEVCQPVCSNTYGTAPCTAEIGVTGEIKCFNTFKTCQDKANYDESSTICWRFTRAATNIFDEGTADGDFNDDFGSDFK